jgi:uncharacterized membrane protein YfcA
VGWSVAAVLLGGLLQSATGTGFAQLAAPVLTAVHGPHESVATLALLGPVVSGLTLSEIRRPQVLKRTAVVLILAGLPGMAVGVLVLRHAPVDVLKVLVALAVLGGVFAVGRGLKLRGSAAGPGFLSGVLATSTGLSGPPMVLYLLGHRARPAEVRDTLAAVFLITGLLTIAALAIGDLLDPAGHLLLLLGATIAGQLLGRVVFRRLGERHREATLGVLVLCALVALVPALQALGV